MGIDNTKLAFILRYCHQLSLLVSPNSASSLGIVGFDGSVCDFLADLARAYDNDEALDIENDEFYSEVYASIEKSIHQIYD